MTAARPGATSLRRFTYALCTLGLASILIGVLAITYANHVADQSYQRSQMNLRQLCSIVVTLDDTYRQSPSTTTLGRKIAAEFAALRIHLGC